MHGGKGKGQRLTICNTANPVMHLQYTIYDENFAKRKFSPISPVDVNGEIFCRIFSSTVNFGTLNFFVHVQLLEILTRVPELAC